MSTLNLPVSSVQWDIVSSFYFDELMLFFFINLPHDLFGGFYFVLLFILCDKSGELDFFFSTLKI